ncbi:MAG: GNAT family N-acetyltransferase [Anaerolineae bacterium]|nr:GNAT family N-acetyltransferase [Anaerolineae bacterium]
MTDSVAVRKVETKADFEAFLKFPWTLYQGDPYWVPPLVSMQRHKLDKRKNPTWQHMEGDYFVAWRGQQPVGTIAAFVNHRYNEYQEENIGFFGLFEVYDDQEAATALLDTATEYVRAKGCDAIRGPASFSTNEECGLLIEGFDDPPVILVPYNYPYYQALIEGVPGFEKAMDLYSYHITLKGVTDASERLQKLFRVTGRNNERRRITISPLNVKNIKREFEMLRAIYNKAWGRNWGFVPFSDVELDELVKELGKFVDPRTAFFASVDGKPAAFLFGIPDMNRVLRLAYPRPGKPEIISLLQVLWHWKIRPKIDRIRIMLMGVQEEFRGIGIESALFVDLYKVAVALNYQTAEGGWVLETNLAMQRLVEPLNAHIYKRHRFYERSLIDGTGAPDTSA